MPDARTVPHHRRGEGERGPFAGRARIDDDTVFEPDAFVRCGKPLPNDTLVITDPVIVVEVVSPSSQRIDALLKLTRYFRNPSIAHYLIVLPEQRSVCHHRRESDERIATTILTTGRLHLDPPGLTIDVGELLGTASETDAPEEAVSRG